MAKSKYAQLHDREWLLEQYEAKQLGATQIAALIGCTRSNVYNALIRHSIPRRVHTSRFPQLNDKEWLREHYQVKQLSTKQIADMLGTTVGNVGSHLRTAGIEVRSYAEGRRVRFNGKRLGATAPNWRGGRRRTKAGYVLVYAPDHPRAGKRGAVQEHILVAEEMLGRYLRPDEVVHHVNHVKDDNRPENLIVKKKGDHTREHFEAGRGFDALKAENARLRQLLIDNGIDPDGEF